MTDNPNTVMTWDGKKWVSVPAESVKEHKPGKPEDCLRCNAILYYELSRIGKKEKQ